MPADLAQPPPIVEHSRAFAGEPLNQLYDAIRQLSEVDRAVILLYLDEKSYSEIIGTNPNNVGVRINRIKAPSESGQALIGVMVENNPGIRLINGVPLILIAGVVAMTIVVELLGGVLFDFDVSNVYRSVFRKVDEMVGGMEKLRAERLSPRPLLVKEVRVGVDVRD